MRLRRVIDDELVLAQDDTGRDHLADVLAGLPAEHVRPVGEAAAAL